MHPPDRRAFRELTSGRRVRHQPGLDGLRGLAVAAVVAFHAGAGWLPGGYLGVSLFFTLSGVVIGTVLLHDVARHGHLPLRRFWARRARRLFPAAWLVLAAIAVIRVTSTVLSATSEGDVMASWLQVANWHFLATGTAYGELFEGPSAVLHFWSLAIEEQLYLVVGVVAAVIARQSRRPDRLLGVVAGAGAAVSFALPFVFGMGVDRVYYGTDTRAGELFVGLVIAAVIASPQRRRRLLRRARPIVVASGLALVATAVLWWRVPAGHELIRFGLLPATALASTLLVLGAVVARGPVWQLACLAPLRWLGGISYALYLVHFPVLVIAARAAPDGGPAVTLAAVAISVLLAALSGRLVEWPVRRRRVPRRVLLAGTWAVVLIAVVSLFVPAQRPRAEELVARITAAAARPLRELETAPPPRRAVTTTSATTPPTAATTTTTTIVAAPVVVGWYGDSVALSLALTMSEHGGSDEIVLKPLDLRIGCGVAFAADSDAVDDAGGSEDCAASLSRAVAEVPLQQAQVALVMSCQWELTPQVPPGEPEARIPGEPTYDQFVHDRYLRAIDELRAAGVARVLWIACPYLSEVVTTPGLSGDLLESRQPWRVDVINGIVAELAAQRDDVDVVDLASWVDLRRDDATLRPDGSHYEFEIDTGVAAELTRLLELAVR